MMTKTKTKTKMYVGIVMGVVLVVGGAIFGSMSLNAVSALFRTSPDISTWTYIYGPDKKSDVNFKDLINYLTSGADIKVQVMGVFTQCQSFYKSEVVGVSQVRCEFTRLQESTDGYQETLYEMMVDKNTYNSPSKNTTSTTVIADAWITVINHHIDGTITKNTFSQFMNSRWYIRK